jgi:hypothetical protein
VEFFEPASTLYASNVRWDVRLVNNCDASIRTENGCEQRNKNDIKKLIRDESCEATSTVHCHHQQRDNKLVGKSIQRARNHQSG